MELKLYIHITNFWIPNKISSFNSYDKLNPTLIILNSDLHENNFGMSYLNFFAPISGSNTACDYALNVL